MGAHSHILHTCRVPRLYHELLDDPVEDVSIVIALTAMYTEVLHCLWAAANKVQKHFITTYMYSIHILYVIDNVVEGQLESVKIIISKRQVFDSSKATDTISSALLVSLKASQLP